MSLIREEIVYSPRFRDLLEKRGLTDPGEIQAFLQPGLPGLHDPFLMKGMSEACRRIQSAVAGGEKVLIHGDYDVDGITGASIAASTLEVLGAECRVFLPDRADDGYGVSEQAIVDGAASGFKLLITVDCGITARDAIRHARSEGMDVIVIDHHRIPAEGLPDANVILNPLQEDCDYPFDDLSAGGLAFKLSQALLDRRALAFLDLAAVSTVCDVAPLRDENRVIVTQGMKLLSRRTHPGFQALANIARLGNRAINVGHIGFVFGPRINAAGRMSSPEIALQLLMSRNEREAASLARVLDEENKARQREERQMVKEAVAETDRIMNFSRDRVIVVAREGWHAGVIGIVAARLVEKYHRPAIVIALDGKTGKGSGRSIKRFDLYRHIAGCAEELEEFGGHPQAAGLVIREDKVLSFRKRINALAKEQNEPEVFVKTVETDMDLGLDEISSVFVRELGLLEPHGMGNPRPVFLTGGLKVKTAPVKLSPQTWQFYVTDGFYVYETTWTNRMAAYGPAADGTSVERDLRPGTPLELIYSIKVKSWEGRDRVILEAKEIRLS